MNKASGHGRRTVVSAVAVVLALAGGGLVVKGLVDRGEGAPPSPGLGDHHHSGSAIPGTGSTTVPNGQPTKAAPGAGAAYVRPVGTLLARSEPTRVRIPSLGVTSPIIKLGLQPNRRMEVPQNGSESGWFTGSPTPGELGPSIVAAHVTWQGKRGAFFSLGSMKDGQRIEIDRTDGSTGVFEVEGIGQYPKKAFPSEKVYGSVNHAALRLITCGGVYDGDSGHHLDNVVVYAKLVSSKNVAVAANSAPAPGASPSSTHDMAHMGH